MTDVSLDCMQQGLPSPPRLDIEADMAGGTAVQPQLTCERPGVALRNLDRKTPTTPPRRMLSYPLNISYARPIVLSCTALHGGHQTMKWGV